MITVRACKGLAIASLMAAANGCAATSTVPPRSTTYTNEAQTTTSGGPTEVRTQGDYADGEAHAPPPPAVPSRAPSVPRGPGGGATPAMAEPDSSGSAMSYWTGRLDAAMEALSNAGSECREICRASGDICVAAREICSLTGDGDSPAPSDGRCARARSACEHATRQRNGSCPVCLAAR
jgi:hypothetical protein